MSNTRCVSSPPGTEGDDVAELVSEFESDLAATERLPQRILRLVLDADGCLYNPQYMRILRFFAHEFGVELSECIRRQDEHAIQRLLDRLNEKIRSGEYVRKTPQEYDQVCQALLERARDVIKKKIVSGGDYTYFKAVIENNDELKYLWSHYIQCMNILSKKFMSSILVGSNHALRQYLLDCHADFEKIILMIGSNRQSYPDDMSCSWTNSTGSIFADMENYKEVVAAIFGGAASIDTITMADINNELRDGESYSRVLNGSQEHYRHTWDHSKLSMMYAFSHRAVDESERRKVTFVFFDDKSDIIRGLEDTFRRYPKFLPEGFRLKLVCYDGSILSESVIEGEGKLDRDYRKNVNMLMSLCPDSAIANTRREIDLVRSLQDSALVDEFFARRDGKCKQESAGNYTVRLFANQRISEVMDNYTPQGNVC